MCMQWNITVARGRAGVGRAGGGPGEQGSCLVGSEFQFCNRKMFPRSAAQQCECASTTELNSEK